VLRSVAIILILTLASFGANLIEAQAEAKEHQVILKLRFDAPFVGRVARKRSEKETVLVLDGAHLPASRSIKAADVSIELLPKEDKSLIVIHAKSHPEAIRVRRTDDGKELELRLLYPQPHATGGDRLYLYWIAILLFGLVAAWGVKKMVGRSEEEVVYTDEPVVRFEKELDPLNRLALISYKGRNYLVILGPSVTLLESFGAGRDDKERFDEMVERLAPTFEQKSEQEPPAPIPSKSIRKKRAAATKKTPRSPAPSRWGLRSRLLFFETLPLPAALWNRCAGACEKAPRLFSRKTPPSAESAQGRCVF